MKKKTFFFRGLPGAGKSTVINQNRLWEKMAVISPDLERSAFPLVDSDDGFLVYDQSVSRQAWANAYLRVGLALADGVDVVFDATFMSQYALNDAKKTIGDAAELVVVDFRVDAATAKARNRQRWGTPAYVPEFVIDRMAKSGAEMSLNGFRVISPTEFISEVTA